MDIGAPLDVERNLGQSGGFVKPIIAFQKAMAASYRLAQQHGWLRDVRKAITAANNAERKSGKRSLDNFGRKWSSKRQLKPVECRKKTA